MRPTAHMADETDTERKARFVANIRALAATERLALRACVQADDIPGLNAELDQRPVLRAALIAQRAIIGIPGRYCVAPWVDVGHRSIADSDPELLGPVKRRGQGQGQGLRAR